MIIVECNADEVVIKSLGFAKRKIKHQPGKGKVLRYLHKNESGIAIIDEDPNSLLDRQLQIHYRWTN